jgi:hypothetical protein
MRESIWAKKTTRVFRTLLSTNAPTRGDPTALSANCMLETRPANRNEQNPIGYFSLASVCPQYYYYVHIPKRLSRLLLLDTCLDKRFGI